MNEPSVGAVIAAAGSGTRFGSDKLRVEIGGKSVLDHTLDAFQNAETVTEIIIVTKEENLDDFRTRYAELPKIRAVVSGGETRGESVERGIRALSESVEYISVHDAARPLITSGEIDRIHRAAFRFGAVCAGSPVVDTLQEIDENGILRATPDRSRFFAAATPQVFEKGTYLQALRATNGQRFTDDAGMVRSAGFDVKAIPCHCENFKITAQADAFLAEKILKKRAAHHSEP